MSVTVVEPSADAFADAVLALLEQLCDDAEHDVRSPRYFFGFAEPAIVERVRATLVAIERAAWDEGDDKIRTTSGQVVLAGRDPVPHWPLERAVVVCSDDYPDPITLRTVERGRDLVLVLDPIRPHAGADALRRLDGH